MFPPNPLEKMGHLILGEHSCKIRVSETLLGFSGWEINCFFPLAQWMRVGGLGGDWGYLALWSSTLLQIEHTVSSHQDEMRWKRPRNILYFYTY